MHSECLMTIGDMLPMFQNSKGNNMKNKGENLILLYAVMSFAQGWTSFLLLHLTQSVADSYLVLGWYCNIRKSFKEQQLTVFCM